jgi:hypothetical protein
VVGENEDMGHVAYSSAEPVDDIAGVASALRGCDTLCHRSLAVVSASLSGVREEAATLPRTARTTFSQRSRAAPGRSAEDRRLAQRREGDSRSQKGRLVRFRYAWGHSFPFPPGAGFLFPFLAVVC